MKWIKNPSYAPDSGVTSYATPDGRFSLSRGSSGWVLTDHSTGTSRYCATKKSGQETAQRLASR